MTVEWVAYTRKDFQFPLVQKFPHRDPHEEVSFGRRVPCGVCLTNGQATSSLMVDTVKQVTYAFNADRR